MPTAPQHPRLSPTAPNCPAVTWRRSPDMLDDYETGRVALSMDATEGFLNAIGAEQDVRFEVYDPHDDVLHLSVLADRALTLAPIAR